MNILLAQLKNKLAEIQVSEEHIKRRWLIGLSACSMLGVILLWVAYMNFAIHSVANENDAIAVPPETETRQSALVSLRTWATAALEDTGSGIASFAHRLMAPRELEIKNDSR